MEDFIEAMIVMCDAEDCAENHQSECVVCGQKTCYKMDPCACNAPIPSSEANKKHKTAA